jgi:hemoglobin/transferrin/lactoferrin receptor protein
MRVIRIKAILAILVAAFIMVAHPCLAADPVEWDLGRIVVSARSIPTDISNTPGGVGVATSIDIELAPKASIADALSAIAGVTPAGDSNWGRDVSIRGLSGPSLVVLVDGMRINTATDLNARLGFINPMDVERVEVLKGPVSSLYGSGSTGGVINIITRKGEFKKKDALHGRVSLSGVSNPAGFDAYGNLQYDAANYWLLASAAARNHDDFRAGGDERVPNSQYRDQQFRLAGAAKISPKLETRFQVMQLEAREVGIPGGPGTLPAAARVTFPRTSATLASLEADYDLGGEIVKELQASFYFNRNQRRVLVDRIGKPAVREIRPGADHQTVGGKLQTTLAAGPHNIVAGMDAWTWHLDSWRFRYLANGAVRRDCSVPDSRQTSWGAYAEDDWKLGESLTLNLGARLDQIKTENDACNSFAAGDQDDTGWNLHAGLTWRQASHWSHTLLAASSYRAADILERFKLIELGGGQQLMGNPQLEPETSFFLEYGLHYFSKSMTADLRLFSNTIYDYISEKRVSPSLLMMHNVGRANIYGAELEGRKKLAKGWLFFASLAALQGRDESADEALPGIAPVSGRAGAAWRKGRLAGRFDARWALEQDQAPSGVPPVGGYVTLGAALQYRLALDGVTHKLLITADNILDRQYENYLAHSRGIRLLEPGLSLALTYTMEF